MTVSGISTDGKKLIGWGTFPVPLAIIAVALRFKSRRLTKQVGADDWCMLAALVLYLGLYTSVVILVPVGKVGFPQEDLSYPQFKRFLRTFWCVQFFYSWWFLWATNVVLALVMIWCVSVTFTVIFECQPVGSYWQPLLQKHCIDSQKFYWGNGISNMLLDVIILCLPMPVIWRLQLTTKRKISLSLVFALGAFVCVASIVRITSLWYFELDNVSGTVAIPSIWTSIEPGLGIVCGCLPALPGLFRRKSERNSSSQGLYQNKPVAGDALPLDPWTNKDNTADTIREGSNISEKDTDLEAMDEA